MDVEDIPTFALAVLAVLAQERKVEILGKETGAEAAPRILASLATAAVPAPQLQQRCATLRALLPTEELGQVLQEAAELLQMEAASLQGSFDTIQEHLGSDEAFKALRENSRLFTLHTELIHFFQVLNEKFADHELRQLYDKAARALPTKKSVGQRCLFLRGGHEVQSNPL
eukprot:s3213_g5.t1